MVGGRLHPPRLDWWRRSDGYRERALTGAGTRSGCFEPDRSRGLAFRATPLAYGTDPAFGRGRPSRRPPHYRGGLGRSRMRTWGRCNRPRRQWPPRGFARAGSPSGGDLPRRRTAHRRVAARGLEGVAVPEPSAVDRGRIDGGLRRVSPLDCGSGGGRVLPISSDPVRHPGSFETPRPPPLGRGWSSSDRDTQVARRPPRPVSGRRGARKSCWGLRARGQQTARRPIWRLGPDGMPGSPLGIVERGLLARPRDLGVSH